jgi:hypothetical protein
MRARWPALALFALCLAPPLWAGGPRGADDKPAGDKPPAKTYRIPYRLTNTSHILVRVKVNGKGPFNFIVDTGAPGFYLVTTAAEKAGLPVLKLDEKGKGEKKGKRPLRPGEAEEKPGKKAGKKDLPLVVLDRLDIEGGASLAKVKYLIETPFQLRGMNAMGLPGEELHGIMGYSVLAHFRMEMDFTRDTMTWTRLDFTPPPPTPLGGKDKDPGQTQLEALGGLMEGLAKFMDIKPAPPPVPRGFLGLELADKGGTVTVSGVLPKSPAAKAGLRKGDRIVEVEGEEVSSSAQVLRLTAKVTAGQTVQLTVDRGGQTKEVTVTAGEGL